jgi:hypothetical protein
MTLPGIQMSESTTTLLQVIFSGLTLLVFIGLAVITWIYAVATKKMAKIMNRDFELRYSPLVDLRVGLPFCLDDYSGFKMALDVLLLGEVAFTLTKAELEVQLGASENKELLVIQLSIDSTLTKNKPSLRFCMGPFAHEKIRRYMEARKQNPAIQGPDIAALYIYHKNIEGQEVLYQRLPVPYRNYYELDKICDKGSNIIGTFGRSIHDELEEY